MYLRTVHAEHSLPVLCDFIKSNPLGILTTAIANPEYPLIQSSHIPWVLDADESQGGQTLPTLRGHIARQNPQAKAIVEEVRSGSAGSLNPSRYTLKDEVMVLFNGPAHHYVTPKFYGETKPDTGKVVPTWNYSAVQAYGRATVYVDHHSPESGTFLSRQIRDLSHAAETTIMGYEKPWTVEDAPERYIDILSKNIIGIEIQITDLGGKFKMSQEMPKGDVEHVIDGFKGMNTDVAREMAATTAEKNEQKLRKT